MMKRFCAAVALALAASACRPAPPPDRVRVSGQVEATEVQLGSPVGGRLLELRVDEGARVAAGDLVARLDVADAELTLVRARSEREQAAAQLRLLQAGPRLEDVRQAEAQVAVAESNIAPIRPELASAEADVSRFETLLAQNSGSRKQRDDAVTRRDVARDRLNVAEQQVRAARDSLTRVQAGARREELDLARARVATADAQMASIQKTIADATLVASVSGVVTQKVADVGELVAPRAPIVIITDLNRVWANVYVDEPFVPQLRLGSTVTLFPDGGGAGIAGQVSYISDKAEFTPRNVQTANERSKLVYRIKVSVDNASGVLKSGMPVEAEIPLAR